MLQMYVSESDGQLAGICGGFQMLGQIIEDPFNVESNPQEASKGPCTWQ